MKNLEETKFYTHYFPKNHNCTVHGFSATKGTLDELKKIEEVEGAPNGGFGLSKLGICRDYSTYKLDVNTLSSNAELLIEAPDEKIEEIKEILMRNGGIELFISTVTGFLNNNLNKIKLNYGEIEIIRVVLSFDMIYDVDRDIKSLCPKIWVVAKRKNENIDGYEYICSKQNSLEIDVFDGSADELIDFGNLYSVFTQAISLFNVSNYLSGGVESFYSKYSISYYPDFILINAVNPAYLG